ncbi:hypothetical protein ABPG75_010658 [Micractinium tetrahymenae]
MATACSASHVACAHRAAAARPRAAHKLSSISGHRSLLRRPQAQPEGKPQDDSISASVERLMQDPENAARLARVTEAAQRVAELQAESERLAAEMAAAAADQAASAEAAERRGAEAAAKLMAEAEVAAKAKLLQAAQLQAESAEAARRKWAGDIDEDAERLESAKAAAAAAIGGAAAALPLAFSEGTGTGAALLALATAGVASALLGVTYRYAVRQDAGNLQLKAGVVAAFGLVRGLGQASGILVAAPGSTDAVAGLDLSVASLGGAGLALGQCMLAAAFAATAVEAGFLQGLIKPFGAAGSTADDGSSS